MIIIIIIIAGIFGAKNGPADLLQPKPLVKASRTFVRFFSSFFFFFFKKLNAKTPTAVVYYAGAATSFTAALYTVGLLAENPSQPLLSPTSIPLHNLHYVLFSSPAHRNLPTQPARPHSCICTRLFDG